MRTSLRTRVRSLLLIAGATVVVASTTACGGEAALPTPGSNNASSGADSIEKILAETPIAGSLPAGSTMAKIKESGKLRVGGTETAALFSLRDPITGKLSGFDATLSQMLAKYIVGEPKTELVQVTSQTRELLLQNGTVDAVFATYTITPARAEKISFAGPYYMSGISIMVKKTDSSIKSMADLAGKTVATQSNSTAATTLTKTIPTATPLLLATNDECLQAVRQGRAQAYIIDQAILIGNAVRNNDVKVVGAPFTQEPYGVGLPPGNAEYKQFVNGWLKKVMDSGLWARLWKLTVGTAVESDPPATPAIGSVAGS